MINPSTKRGLDQLMGIIDQVSSGNGQITLQIITNIRNIFNQLKIDIARELGMQTI